MTDSPFEIVYLPVNQAWMVMFGDSRLAGPYNDKAEAEDYLRELAFPAQDYIDGKMPSRKQGEEE